MGRIGWLDSFSFLIVVGYIQNRNHHPNHWIAPFGGAKYVHMAVQLILGTLFISQTWNSAPLSSNLSCPLYPAPGTHHSTSVSVNLATLGTSYKWNGVVQFSSVTQSCPTLCDPMDCSTLGLLVHHQLLEFTQTHVHWVSDATQPSYPLLSPSPLAFNLSQHQGLFKWVSSSHQVAKVLEFQPSVLPMNTQDWSPLGWIGWISLLSKGLSRVSSNTSVQKHQFFGAQRFL